MHCIHCTKSENPYLVLKILLLEITRAICFSFPIKKLGMLVTIQKFFAETYEKHNLEVTIYIFFISDDLVF